MFYSELWADMQCHAMSSQRLSHAHQGATQLNMRHLLSWISVIPYDNVKEHVFETLDMPEGSQHT
jgi:hypothetical protein